MMGPSIRAVTFWSAKRCSVAILSLMATLTVAGCTSVEPWQKGDLAVDPMQIEDDGCHRFERNIEVYREGAVGANGGKSGGGCGCT